MLGPDPARFYFFEELDTGIHPALLYLLVEFIEQTVKNRDIQVVGTTHSPQLLSMLSPQSLENASLVYRLQGATDGRIRRILDIPEAKRLLGSRNISRLMES